MGNDDKQPYVLVSVFKQDAKPEEIANAAPALSLLIDEWHNDFFYSFMKFQAILWTVIEPL